MKRWFLIGNILVAFCSALAAATTDPFRKAQPLLVVININTASESELTSLHGIDVLLARAIIEYRHSNGPFKTIEDVRKVQGMTQDRFEGIRDQIVVSGHSRLPADYDAPRKETSPKETSGTSIKARSPKEPGPPVAPKPEAPATTGITLPLGPRASKPPPRQPIEDATKASSPIAASPQAVESRQSAGMSDVSPDEEVAAVDKYYAELKQANIVFSAPQSMDESSTSAVNLWLDPTATLASLEDALRAVVKKTDRVESVSAIKWAPRTRATLSSPGFDIAPQPAIELAVSATTRTEWTWQIRPKESGTQTLHLSLEAIVPCEGRDCFRVIRTFDRNIEVRVSPGDFLEQNWQWLVATLIVPFGAWLWNRKRPLAPKPRSH